MDTEPAPQTPQPSPEGAPLVTDSASFFAKAFEGFSVQSPGEGQPADAAPAPSQEAPVIPQGVDMAEPPNDIPSISSVDVLGKATSPAEALDDPLPEDVANASPKAQSSWREMKKIIKERTKEAKELQRLLDEEKAKKASDPVEVESLKAKLEEKERVLYTSQVTATDEYKAAVTTPLATLEGKIAALAAKRAIPEEDIKLAFAESDPDKQEEMLGDLASGLNEFERLRFYELAKEHASLVDIKRRILENSKEAMQRVEEHRAAQEKEAKDEYVAKMGNALDNTWRVIQERLPLFREQEGNDAWNKTLREIDSTARSMDFDALPPESRALVAYRASIAPVATKMLFDLYSEHQKLTAELAKIKGATPRAGASSQPSSQVDHAASGTTFTDIIKQSIGGLK